MNKLLLVFAFLMIFFSNFEFGQTHKKEVNVMKKIWSKLGFSEKIEGDLDKDPCNAGSKWQKFVICNCSTTCSIVSIIVESIPLSALPSEIAKLPHLETLSLNANYLTGNVPPEWATMSLISISLGGNQLSGSFPIALTRIRTLIRLNLEGNHFSGLIPGEIANLKNLCQLIISSNDFNGELPIALAKLSNLTELRISDLKGEASTFPVLENMRQLITL